MTSANVDTLRDSASDALDRLQRVAAPPINEGKRQAGVLLDQSGGLIETVSTTTSESAADLARRVIAYTKENPLISLLLVVGAGVLLVSTAASMASRR